MVRKHTGTVRIVGLLDRKQHEIPATTPSRTMPAEVPECLMNDFGTDEEDVANLKPVALADTTPGETIMLYDNATGAWWPCVVVEHVTNTDAAD